MIVLLGKKKLFVFYNNIFAIFSALYLNLTVMSIIPYFHSANEDTVGQSIPMHMWSLCVCV